MRTFALYVSECQFIRSMMSLRKSYAFQYSIRPSIDISLREANISAWELKPVRIDSIAVGTAVGLS